MRMLRSLRTLLLLAMIVAGLASPPARADEAAPFELRMAVNSLPASLGNPFRGNGRPGSLVWSAIFDALTELDADGQLRPALATGWEPAGPTLWRFSLRDDVRFANGRVFDSGAVVAIMEWLISPEGRRTVIGNELRGVKVVRAAGPTMVEIETAEPDPILPKRMAAVMMVEPDLWRQLGPDGFALAPVGTGSFLLTGWDQRRRQARAVANPYRWRPSDVTGLTFMELPNAAVRAQALLSGDVDIAGVEIDELERLRRNGFPIHITSSMQVMSIAFRVEGTAPTAPLRDVRVRQALNYAIDKQALADVLLEGLAGPAGQPAPAFSFGYDPSLAPYPYDPARARALLREAGYADGFTLTAEVVIDSVPADTLIYQAVAQYWRAVGVGVTLQIITFPQYLKKFLTNSWTVDAFGASWNSSPYNDALRPMEVFSCRRPKPFFCDRAMADRLGHVGQIMDDGERLAAMQALAHDYQVAAPAAFLVDQIDLFSNNPGLSNIAVRNRVPDYRTIRRGTAKGQPTE